MTSPLLPFDRAHLDARVRAMLAAHWVSAGYTAPNATVYPWQWLWDSCFHALIWHACGESDRALVELRSALSTQTRNGFVPHMNYQLDPGAFAAFWGRAGASSITQPPMYGHAIAELVRDQVPVGDELIARACAGVRFLLERRARDLDSGLVLLCHPWESGADNSARWDQLFAPEFSAELWYRRKGEFVNAIIYDSYESPVVNPGFAVASVAFNALIAFNALELADVTGDDGLRRHGAALAEALDARFDPELVTWIDAGPTVHTSGRIRTTEALLPLVVSGSTRAVEDAFALLRDDRAYGAPFGPTGAHRREPTFAPSEYWRGATWPQINYLLWLAAHRQRRAGDADMIAAATVHAAIQSGLAEYWHPDTGEGLGAIPQSWTGLALLMAPR